MLRHVYLQVIGLFINAYLHPKNESQLLIHLRNMTITFAADHFNMNNTNDNPKRFILLLT